MLVAVLLYGDYFLFERGRVHTDNAYVGADSAQITPLVAGPVAEVRVSNTQTVKAGDVLVVLDDSDAKVDVATAEAALAQARQRFGQASATVTSAGGRLDARDADIAQAQAQAVTEAAKRARRLSATPVAPGHRRGVGRRSRFGARSLSGGAGDAGNCGGGGADGAGQPCLGRRRSRGASGFGARDQYQHRA